MTPGENGFEVDAQEKHEGREKGHRSTGFFNESS